MASFNFQTLVSNFRPLVYLFVSLICLIIIFSTGKVDVVEAEQSSFRVITYNIHHGEGVDGIVDLERISEVIKKENPDILLLQEIDVGLERSGNVDIPKYLSSKIGLNEVAFGKNLDIENGGYGNATLSKFPIIRSKNFQFQQIGPEQRGVLVTEISLDGKNFLVLNSHFDHSKDDSERILYAEKIINHILPKYNTDAVLFGGDFNDIPTSPMYHKLMDKFKDAWIVSGRGDGYTIPSDQPSKRIDYILFDGKIKPDSVWVPGTEASDHLPVAADFIWVDEE